MGVHLGPRSALPPPPTAGAAADPAQIRTSAKGKGTAPTAPAPAGPAVVLERAGAPPLRAPPPVPPTLRAAARPQPPLPPLQQAHLHVQDAARVVARTARAAPGARPPLLDEAAALVQLAARVLRDTTGGRTPRSEEDRQTLAVLRTFWSQALDAEGLRSALLLPGTLRDVQMHLERLLARLELPTLHPDDPRLQRPPSGDWAWAPEPGAGDGLLPRFDKAAALLVGVVALGALWLVQRVGSGVGERALRAVRGRQPRLHRLVRRIRYLRIREPGPARRLTATFASGAGCPRGTAAPPR